MSIDYARRLEERKAVVERVRAADELLGNIRLAIIFSLPVVAVFAFGWVWIPVVVFLMLTILHGRSVARRRRAEKGMTFYERGIGRIENRWAGTGRAGSDYLDLSHPYAADLDLFGQGSLFELLCTVQTRAAEQTLASWLLAPAAPDVIRERHAAVNELRDRVDLREDLAVLGEELRVAVQSEKLASWGAAPRLMPGVWARLLGFTFTAAMIASILAWWLTDIGSLPFLAVFILQQVYVRFLRDRVGRVLSGVDQAERELSVLAGVLARLERESFASPRLRELQSALSDAAKHIRSLARVVSVLDSYRNELFMPAAFLLMWKIHFAFAVESWRVRWGRSAAGWLAAVGEIEALGAFAGYAYEHPSDSLPEIIEHGPLFDGTDLGHPLIPESSCIRNSVTLDATRRVLMVSGSNMSGKSTMLRTVGTNTVLALAGAPVRAKRLRLCPLSIGATIRIQDSLQAGTSRFYAEIKRLRQIMDLTTGPRPMLFLLDEILHGTNSHDRRIGAESLIRALIAQNAIGLVTTHDLSLAEAADALAPQAANVHFEDQIVDGKLQFDYLMRPGVVKKSNALALMRAVGLSV